jgi:glutamate receptor, ionotropic, invertebrate
MSQSSHERYPESSFSACIHEVGLGRTDICIGNFWPTAERSIISQFTADLYQDNFYLVTFQQEATSVGEFFSTAFRPFSGYVWLMIAVITVFVAATYVYIEGWTNHSEFPESTTASKFFSSLYFKIISFLGGAPVHVPETPQGRVISTSFGFFILVIVASYTANLASFLVIQSVHGQFDSIETGVQMGVKFCGQAALQSTIVAQYPQLARIYIPKKNTIAALHAMEEGECGAAIVSKNDLDYARRGRGLSEGEDVTVHCNKVQVGDVVFSLGNGLPVSPDMHRAVSWATVHYATMYPYFLDAEKAKNTFLNPFVCTADSGVSSAGKLTLIDLGGVMVITICGVLFAVVWFMISSRCNNKGGTNDKTGGTEEESIVASDPENHLFPKVQ